MLRSKRAVLHALGEMTVGMEFFCISVVVALAVGDLLILVTVWFRLNSSALAGSSIRGRCVVCQSSPLRRIDHVGIRIETFGHFVTNYIDQTLEDSLFEEKNPSDMQIFVKSINRGTKY